MESIERFGRARVGTLSTVHGDFVICEVPVSLLASGEAEQIAESLHFAAQMVRARSVQPTTRLLPLSEPFRLVSSLGDSRDGDGASGNRCADTLSGQ